ncbi:MAG: hypothetical protein M3063_03380 [Actinomycetota bacterium]|nr:hypothetical protein [Actinomycetota bacterium]
MRWLVRFAVGFGVGWALASARIIVGLALFLIWIGVSGAQGHFARMNEWIAGGVFFLWLGFRIHGGFVRHRGRVGWDH